MKWMLVIVVITFADDVSHRSVMFESKEACVAAGKAFTARFPGFDWHDPDDESAIVQPVVKQQVRCVPAEPRIVAPT